MRLHHKTPCNACPWRKTSPQGYLGGWSAEGYADAVQENRVPACHQTDLLGPEDPHTAFCAGALACMTNACIMPDEGEPGQEGAREARQAIAARKDVFAHPRDFYKHHTGEDYVPRIIRLHATRKD